MMKADCGLMGHTAKIYVENYENSALQICDQLSFDTSQHKQYASQQVHDVRVMAEATLQLSTTNLLSVHASTHRCTHCHPQMVQAITTGTSSLCAMHFLLRTLDHVN